MKKARITAKQGGEMAARQRKRERDAMKKSPALYITMLCIWTALTIFLWVNFVPKIVNVPFFEGRKI